MICFGTILNYMTLKPDGKGFALLFCFGTILNYMTLKLYFCDNVPCVRFGTILNYMTLKPQTEILERRNDNFRVF